MKKFFKNKQVSILLLCILVLLAIVIYTIYDNTRIKIVEQDVYIKNLPVEFLDFKILQITDLHGKRFGENQEILLEIINSIDYDIIAITGDMINRHTMNIEPFIELLDGINNKQYVFFTEGNVDNKVANEDGELTEIGELLQDKGCNLLLTPTEIIRDKSRMIISQFISNEEYTKLMGAKDVEDAVKIALTHYPRHEEHYNENIPNYNLVLAGHYHGGQWRIPLYGALFVPDIYTNIKLFPKQSDVSGLNTWGNNNQYVSRGLGASSKLKFLEFRLFNTPEVNILTLKSN